MASTVNLGSIYAKLILDSKEWGSAIKNAQKDLKTFQSTSLSVSKAVGGSMKSLGSSFVSATKQARNLAAIGITAVSGAMVLFGRNAVKMAGELEAAEQGFVALLGSSEKASAVMTRIKKEAAATPFEIPGLVTGTQALTAITKDGDKAIDVLLDVGKAIATSGKGQAELDRVILNLQQIASTGKVTAMDIRQFQGAIPMFNDILEYSGLTVQSLQNSSTAAEDLFKAFEKAGEKGGITAAGFEAQAGTYNQLLSNLKDTITITGVELVKNIGIFDGFKVVLAKVTEQIGYFGNKLSFIVKLLQGDYDGDLGKLLGINEDDDIVTKWLNIGDAVRGFIELIQTDDIKNFGEAMKELGFSDETIEKFGWIAGKMREFGNWVVENQEMILTFLKGLAIAFGALAIVGFIATLIGLLTNPLTILVIALGLLYTAWTENWGGIQEKTRAVIDFLISKYKENEAWITATLQVIQAVIQGFINLVVAWWQIFGDNIIGILKGAWNVIKGIFQVYAGVIMAIVGVFIGIFTGDWETAWQTVKKGAEMGLKGLTNIFDGLRQMVFEAMKAVFETFTSWFGKVWEEAKKIAEKIRSAIKDAFDKDKHNSPSIMDTIKSTVKAVNREINSFTSPEPLAHQLGQANFAGVSASGYGSGQLVNSPTFNVNIGTYAGSAMEKRELAKQLWDALQDYNKSTGDTVTS